MDDKWYTQKGVEEIRLRIQALIERGARSSFMGGASFGGCSQRPRFGFLVPKATPPVLRLHTS